VALSLRCYVVVRAFHRRCNSFSFCAPMTLWEATHTGIFFGVPATGKALRFATADRYRLQDGLLVEHWDVVDALDAWVALGIVVRRAGP
jgi:hypothetical protein